MYSIRDLGKDCSCSVLHCPQSCPLWKELAGCNLPSSSHCLIQMTPFAPQSYRLPLISELELYFLLLFFFFLKEKKSFPTGRIIICLPCCFGSNSSFHPRAGPLVLLLLRKLCHRLPPGSAGGQSPLEHALHGSAQGLLVPGLGSRLAFERERAAHRRSWEPHTRGT